MAGLLSDNTTTVMPQPNTKLDNTQENMFMQWYQNVAKKIGINPNPDDPNHFYDYRGAWLAGASPGVDNHWPSQFKHDNHPNRYVPYQGMLLDTKYGKLINPNLLVGGR